MTFYLYSDVHFLVRSRPYLSVLNTSSSVFSIYIFAVHQKRDVPVKVIYGSMTKVTFKTKFKNCCMSYTIKSPMELNYMLFLTRKYLCYLDKYSGCVA